jgi:hypothetical protein
VPTPKPIMEAARVSGFRTDAITDKSISNRGIARPAVKGSGSVLVGVMHGISEDDSPANAIVLLWVIGVISA